MWGHANTTAGQFTVADDIVPSPTCQVRSLLRCFNRPSVLLVSLLNVFLTHACSGQTCCCGRGTRTDVQADLEAILGCSVRHLFAGACYSLALCRYIPLCRSFVHFGFCRLRKQAWKCRALRMLFIDSTAEYDSIQRYHARPMFYFLIAVFVVGRASKVRPD